MDDLISRREAIKALNRNVQDVDVCEDGYNDGYNDGIYDSVEELRNLPPAERPSGVWVGIDDFPYETWECSNCGCIYEGERKPNFCGDCGADMRGGNNG